LKIHFEKHQKIKSTSIKLGSPKRPSNVIKAFKPSRKADVHHNFVDVNKTCEINHGGFFSVVILHAYSDVDFIGCNLKKKIISKVNIEMVCGHFTFMQKST
jgi:hypothetical protein